MSHKTALVLNFKCLDREVFNANLHCNFNNKYWELTVNVEDTAGRASIQIVQWVRLAGALKGCINQPNNIHIEKA